MNTSASQPADPDSHVTEKPIRNARREVAEVGLCLLLALVVFFWPAVFGGRALLPTDLIFDLDPLWRPLAPARYIRSSNPILSDQVYMYFPWKVFTVRSLAQGHLPLWNPYVHGGLPFVGNLQSAVLSPFKLLSYLFPLYPSFAIEAVLRLFAAGLFTFLFAREIGLSKPGALLAAVAFIFSGPMVVWVGYPLSPVIAWLPAMLLTIERGLVRKDGPCVVACGLAIAAQFLGGHPETSFHVMLAWAAYALYRAVYVAGWYPTRLLPLIARIAAAAAMGIMLAAVQLLPFAQALFHSAAASIKEAQAFDGMPSYIMHVFFEWRNWPTGITTLLPQYFGTDLDGSYWFPYNNYVEQNAYAGILPLALAVMVTLRNIKCHSSPRRGLILFFAVMSVICLGVALRLPLLNVANDLPILNLIANGRMRLVYVFAIAILAGLGLDEIGKGHEHCHRTTLRLLVLFALISLVLIILAYAGFTLFKDEVVRSGRAFIETNWGSPYLTRPIEYYYALVQERYAKKLALFHPRNVVMYLPVLIALSWFALYRWDQGRKYTHRGIWTCAALGLTMFDVFLVGIRFNPTIALQDIFPTPGAIQFLQQDHDVYRISGTGAILYPNSGMVFGLSDIRGYDPMASRRYIGLVDRLQGHYRYHFHSLFVQTNSPLFDLLNVKYVLTDQELDGKWELVYKDAGSVKVYRNRDVLPRAFVVHRVEIVDDDAQSLARITDSTFNFRERVVLEEMPLGWVEPSEMPAPATVHIVDYEPDQVEVKVETSAPGLLVLTDAFAPGWKALVDDHPVPVFVADHAFRAVMVPTGTHRVDFAYEPLAFRVGAVVSLLAAVSMAAILLRRSPFYQVKRTEGTGR